MGLQKVVEPIEYSLDLKKIMFTKLSNECFVRQKRIEHMFVYLPTTGSSFKKMDHLYLNKRVIKKYAPGGEVMDGLLKQAMEKGFAIQEVKSVKRYFVVARKGNSPKIKRDYLVVAVFASPSLYETFATPSAYKNYLLSKNQFLSMEPKYKWNKDSELNIGSVDFFAPIIKSKFPTGVAEIKNYAGQNMLVSFAKVGVSDLIVASVVEKSKSMMVVDEIKNKTLFFVFSVLSLAMLIGIVASQGLVASIKELVEGKYTGIQMMPP